MMTLSSEICWGLGITFLIGLLLIRQSILICTDQKTDILMELIKWGRSKSIALLSIVFITSIFISPYSINYFLNRDELLEIVLDKAPTYLPNSSMRFDGLIQIGLLIIGVITGAASIFIGNSYLDGSRKAQERVNIAKLIIISIQGQIISLDNIAQWLHKGYDLSFSGTPSEYYNNVYVLISSIKNDRLYKTALSNIGIFDLRESETIAQYSRKLDALMVEVEILINPCKEISSNSWRLDDKPLPLPHTWTHHLIERAQDVQLYAELQIFVLSKTLVKDNQLFEEYKERVVSEYSLRKNRFDYWRTGSEFNLWLRDVEKWFEKLDLYDELESSYQTQKLEFEEGKKQDFMK